jgi:hypothetical protein
MTDSNLIQKPAIKKNDVVLVTRETPSKHCLAVVHKVFDGGVLGRVRLPGAQPHEKNWLTVELAWDEFKLVGNLDNPRVPRQKPGKSRQDYETPPELLAAVEARFGQKLTIDLAARNDNAKAPTWITPEMNSLSKDTDWGKLIGPKGLAWLNPEFSKITPWAKKCAEYGQQGYKILLLTPLTTANWCTHWIKPYARVLGLNPRVTFVGEDHCYIKDLQIACFGFGKWSDKVFYPKVGFEYWNWQEPWEPKRRAS